jgi:hypothetical protein
MTTDSKVWLFKIASGIVLFCVWLVLVTFITTISCIALFHLVMQNEQVNSAIEHSEIWRTAIVMSIGVAWMVLQVVLVFLLPIRILKKRQRR